MQKPFVDVSVDLQTGVVMADWLAGGGSETKARSLLSGQRFNDVKSDGI